MSKIAMLAAVLLGAIFCAAGCGVPAIHRAARDNNPREVLRLAEAGVDLNAYNDPIDQWTAVEMAAHNGHRDALLALLAAGARPELGRHRAAVAERHPEMVKLIEDRAAAGKGTGPRPEPAPTRRGSAKDESRYHEALAIRTPASLHVALTVALRNGWLDRIDEAVAAGADPNGRYADVPVINGGIAAGQTEAVAHLISLGANPSLAYIRPGMGRKSGIDTARDEGFTEIVALLEKAAAAPRPRPRPGNLDDAAYDRMRASAGMAPEKRAPASDVDSPTKRGVERPDDFALVIGVEDYQSLPKADYGVRDAQTVRKHLEALGYPARNIISLEGPQATGNKLKSYLEEWLPLNVKPTSTLFVYYSGHGAPDPQSGDAYLVPWDGDATFLKSTAYPLKKFYADLSKTKAKRVLVALDACFSGAGGRSVLAQGARPLVAKVAEVSGGERVTILAAASGEEITGSLNEQGHGMFTYFLLKGLSEGKRTAKELHSYLTPRVQDEARRQNRQQTPALIGADAPF